MGALDAGWPRPGEDINSDRLRSIRIVDAEIRDLESKLDTLRFIRDYLGRQERQ